MAELTTIVRVHSPECFGPLADALFSIDAQRFRGIHVIVSAQNLGDEAASDLEQLAKLYQREAVEDITILRERSEQDLRSRQLNVALAKVSTRFVSFLDFDDVVYPDCYEQLTRRLKRTDAAIAFGRVVSTYFEQIGEARYIRRKVREFSCQSAYDLAIENFCPIHSYVLDASRIERADLHFDESLTVLEDYEFLLRMIVKYPTDFRCMNIDVAEYYRRSDDTVADAQAEHISSRHRVSRLDEARRFITDRKRELAMSVPLSEIPFIAALPSARAAFEARLAAIRDPEPIESRAAKALLGHLYSSFASANLSRANGFVDSILPASGAVIVSGWADEKDATLLMLLRKGGLVETVTRTHRPDVCKHLGKEGDFGFKFCVPFSKGTISSPDDVLVLAAFRANDGYGFKRLPWFDKAEVVEKREMPDKQKAKTRSNITLLGFR
jgi:hypothetical protein